MAVRVDAASPAARTEHHRPMATSPAIATDGLGLAPGRGRDALGRDNPTGAKRSGAESVWLFDNSVIDKSRIKRRLGRSRKGAADRRAISTRALEAENWIVTLPGPSLGGSGG
jgi:hypothetical protein